MTTRARIDSVFAPRAVRVLTLLMLFVVAGCQKEPNRFDQVQDATRRNAPAVSKEAVPGASFNKLFPKPEGDNDIVYTQEKTGFAQAKIVKKGQDVATLAIFDTVSDPSVADEYKKTEEKFEDFPIRDVGNNGTAILVGGRYQVQVRSTDANFTKFDREDWLKKFDLANLAKLQ
jgi:hypothetical protein